MGFQQGLSGLNASSKNLDVIGNNIANANTYGAKVARAEFADVYANAVSGTSNTIGIGTTLATVAQQFTQGNVTTTDNPLDVAINGSGFFQVSNPSGSIAYSRNGQFKVDNTGFIVNDQGQRLMGYPANAAGIVIPGTATALQMPTAGLTPAVTTAISMQMNLDSAAAVTLPAAGPTWTLSTTCGSPRGACAKLCASSRRCTRPRPPRSGTRASGASPRRSDRSGTPTSSWRPWSG